MFLQSAYVQEIADNAGVFGSRAFDLDAGSRGLCDQFQNLHDAVCSSASYVEDLVTDRTANELGDCAEDVFYVYVIAHRASVSPNTDGFICTHSFKECINYALAVVSMDAGAILVGDPENEAMGTS